MGSEMRRAGIVLALVFAAAAGLAAGARPLVGVLGTCAALAPGPYPSDTRDVFDAGKDSQVVFCAHLFFPDEPFPEEELPDVAEGPWHPPMAAARPLSPAAAAKGGHYAEAEWLDPNGARVCLYGMTLAAKAGEAPVRVAGRDYQACTFAMAVGTRDVRADAGQVKLPEAPGVYSVRLRVDGRSVGLSFFKVAKTAAPAPAQGPSSAPAGAQGSAGGNGVAAALAAAEGGTLPQTKPSPVPALPGLSLP
jgi:hypothetical protein